MARFRKKPVVIEAEQWTPDGSVKKGVHWERKSLDHGEFLVPFVVNAQKHKTYLVSGDWIIPEPVGTGHYVCKPDAFEKLYEPDVGHDYWGAGEPDCPKEIKASNGELHTLRCKRCGLDSPRDKDCHGGVA